MPSLKKTGWGRTNGMAKQINRLGRHQWYGQTNTQGGDALTVLPNEQTGWGRTNDLAKRTNKFLANTDTHTLSFISID